MTSIANNDDFKQYLKNLDCQKQRKLAALFAQNVLDLTQDERIPKILATARQEPLDQQEMETACKLAKAAIVDSHCRCGSDCDWVQQAAYFVARAAAAAVSPENKCMTDSAAWQAAVNARMARTSASIENDDIDPQDEISAQFRITNDFINNEAAS